MFPIAAVRAYLQPVSFLNSLEDNFGTSRFHCHRVSIFIGLTYFEVSYYTASTYTGTGYYAYRKGTSYSKYVYTRSSRYIVLSSIYSIIVSACSIIPRVLLLALCVEFDGRLYHPLASSPSGHENFAPRTTTAVVPVQQQHQARPVQVDVSDDDVYQSSGYSCTTYSYWYLGYICIREAWLRDKNYL